MKANGSGDGSGCKVITEAQKEELYRLARQAGDLAMSMLRSFSGADQADSEARFCERNVYVDVAAGVPFAEAYAKQDARWRAYAAESGHSAISHRWVSPDKFECMKSHMCFMVERTLTPALAEAEEPAPNSEAA